MGETTVDDPVFGKLSWDGLQHEGWGGSFVDERFSSWGAAIAAELPDDEPEEKPKRPGTVAQNFLSLLLAVGGAELEKDPEGTKMIQAARELAQRVDAYDGSLDVEPLRRAGRFKVVVRNPREEPPKAAQQAAWRAFRDRGEAMEEEIAAALLETYRRQLPERVRWWNIVYGDASDRTLPEVSTTEEMRRIVRPREFRVYREQNGGATVAVVLEAFWCDENIKVGVRDGKVTGIDRLERSHGFPMAAAPEEIESPVFGQLRSGRTMGGWTGVFHSDFLRGWDKAAETRYRFQDKGHFRNKPMRPGPPWETVTGNFGLSVRTAKGELPSPEQEAAFERFNADPAATAELVLSAIMNWYRERRPNWVKGLRGTPESIASVMPDVRTPGELLEIIQLQSVSVLPAAEAREATGPREMTMAFGPKAGQKITLPPRSASKAGVAIILSFHWEDEHGLGVRWRDGSIEKVGDWESVEE